MSKLFFALSLLVFFASCSSESGSEGGEADSVRVAEDSLRAVFEEMEKQGQEEVASKLKVRPDTLSHLFDKYGVTGAFALFDPQKGEYFYHNFERTSVPLSPASTFKIIHALIALETGALSDTAKVFKWDGVKRDIELWNQDQTLRSAIKNSTVWVFQQLAKSIGEKRMQHYINLVGYGNKDISGKIDSFWLDGDLKISMQEQIEFLRKLYREELPFSNKTMKTVKSMLLQEETENYAVYGKTGWSVASEPNVGWYVGYLITKPTEDGEVPKGYYFSTVVDIEKPEDAKARKAITYDILKYVKLM